MFGLPAILLFFQPQFPVEAALGHSHSLYQLSYGGIVEFIVTKKVIKIKK